MMLDAIRTEAPLEEIGNPAVFELTRLYLRQIVRQREKPESRRTELLKSLRHLRVRRHRREFFKQFLPIGVPDPYTADVRQYLHHSRTYIGERLIASGYRAAAYIMGFCN